MHKYLYNNMDDIEENVEEGNAEQEEDLASKSKQELIFKINRLMSQNKRLRSRLADHEPQRNKKIRPPNPKKIQELFEQFETKKYALKVCYLGSSYDGMAYQKESDNNTVEAYILRAMHSMSLIKEFNAEANEYTRAGRTDKGVSAMGNVIALRMRSNQRKNEDGNQKATKKISHCSMLNAILPDDIRIIGVQEVSDDFNARYWCIKRSYKYFFPKNNLNIQKMEEAIKHFEGTHNFLNYCKMNLTNTVSFEKTIFQANVVKSSIDEVFQDDRNQIYYFHFVGNSFLWHQIRFMSSVLFLVGCGKEQPSIVRDLLDLQKFPKKPNYPMAPDYALILEDCLYEQVHFQPDMETIVSFYNTFNAMVMKKSTEKTLMINCMLMAQQDLLLNMKIGKEMFIGQTIEKSNKMLNKGGKSLEMLKSSARGMEEAVSSLKGKKLEIYEKKMEKLAQYEKTKKQREQQSEGQKD